MNNFVVIKSNITLVVCLKYKRFSIIVKCTSSIPKYLISTKIIIFKVQYRFESALSLRYFTRLQKVGVSEYLCVFCT